MYNNRPHPLLEQVPLTVSPFVSLPSATTLSYNYKTLPSNIPASSLGIPTAGASSSSPSASEITSAQPKPQYVVSSSGYAAHPDDILKSCHALQAHIFKMQEDAERELRQFEERISERELAEKRRLAPGWLDSNARLLKPERAASAQQEGEAPAPPLEWGDGGGGSGEQGVQLDRAFGSMTLQ